MKSERLLDVISVVSVVGIGFVLSSIRREWIRVEYSLSWLLAATVLLILGRWRSLDEWMAGALGVNNWILAILLLISTVFVVVLYRLSLVVSTLTDSNIKLAQKIAYLQFRLESTQQENGSQ
jgi:hypothetical protein